MTPIDFLYSNLTLNPAPGDEERVRPIKAYRAQTGGFVTAWQLSEEELEIVNKTHIIWHHVSSGTFAPVSLHAIAPALDPVTLFRHSPNLENRVIVLNYLELGLVLIEGIPADRDKFAFKTVKLVTDDELSAWSIKPGEPAEIFELVSRKGEGGELFGDGPDGMLFSEAFDINGRVKDLPIIKPLQLIHDFITDEMLVLTQKLPPAPGMIVKPGGGLVLVK